ncbi:hypothetical protein O181_029705 [Austropuccinia psidii MF-1]|uniref:Uncharacterized protein n=1 Tax=Austropuccinia psidii MF-1 TaxID=1389203 RepID=A0A9Q3CUW8_9BASI|nr:hypothetical protein [Austropuccinia psidii MF-1]
MVDYIVDSITLLHTTFIRLYLLITSYSVRYWHTNSVPDILEENYIPLETQSQANIPVTPSEPVVPKGKGKRQSEGLITAKRWTPIATQRNKKPQNSASIQGKQNLTAFTGNITIINPALTSKGKFPKAEDNRFVQGTVKENLASKGTSQKTEEACPEPEDLEEDTFDTAVDGKTLREIIPTLPFTFQFNRNLKQEDWKDMDQALQLHQLLKDLFQWSMENKRFNLASHWAELGTSFQPYDNHHRFESHQAVQTHGGEGKQNKGESSHYPSYRRTADPDSAYSDNFRLARRRPNQLSSGFTPLINKKISGQESPFFTIPGSFQEKTGIQGQKQ